MSLPVLGTQTADVEELDARYMEDEDLFKKNAAILSREREAAGDTSIYSRMQPFYRPNLDELLERRIDVLTGFDIIGKNEQELRWCQGKVIKVYDDKPKPTVQVEWDPLPDIEGGNQTEETDQVLLPTYWRKDIAGAWRMDVDVGLAVSDNISARNEGINSGVIWEDSSSSERDFGTSSDSSSDSDSDSN